MPQLVRCAAIAGAPTEQLSRHPGAAGEFASLRMQTALTVVPGDVS